MNKKKITNSLTNKPTILCGQSPASPLIPQTHLLTQPCFKCYHVIFQSAFGQFILIYLFTVFLSFLMSLIPLDQSVVRHVCDTKSRQVWKCSSASFVSFPSSGKAELGQTNSTACYSTEHPSLRINTLCACFFTLTASCSPAKCNTANSKAKQHFSLLAKDLYLLSLQ